MRLLFAVLLLQPSQPTAVRRIGGLKEAHTQWHNVSRGSAEKHRRFNGSSAPNSSFSAGFQNTSHASPTSSSEEGRPIAELAMLSLDVALVMGFLLAGCGIVAFATQAKVDRGDGEDAAEEAIPDVTLSAPLHGKEIYAAHPQRQLRADLSTRRFSNVSNVSAVSEVWQDGYEALTPPVRGGKRVQTWGEEQAVGATTTLGMLPGKSVESINSTFSSLQNAHPSVEIKFSMHKSSVESRPRSQTPTRSALDRSPPSRQGTSPFQKSSTLASAQGKVLNSMKAISMLQAPRPRSSSPLRVPQQQPLGTQPLRVPHQTSQSSLGTQPTLRRKVDFNKSYLRAHSSPQS